MEHPEISLRPRLLTGYAAVILLFSLFGLYALHSFRTLQLDVVKTHDHPLAVTRAALQAGGDITAMHRYMKDVAMSRSAADRDEYAAMVAELEGKIYARLDVIRKRILDERGGVLATDFARDFRAWEPIRSKVTRLLRAGRSAEAQKITREEGEVHVRLLMSRVDAIRAHASAKAALFLAESERTASEARMIAIGSLILAIVSCTLLALVTTSRLQREVSQRLETENELRRERDFISRALDSQQDTFFLFEIATGTPVRWNHAFGELSGYSDEEISSFQNNRMI